MKNSQKLLEKIRSEKISQKSRLQFILKNIFFWILFIFSIIIGGLSFSIILFAFDQEDFNLILQITDSRIEFFLGLLPFFWIISCFVFLLISIFMVRHTKTGYRYSPFLVFISSIILSIILGTSLFFTGGAGKMEQIFSENISIYKSVEEHRISRWSHPENGFLAGVILENRNDETILIKDFNDKEWEIDIQNTVIRRRVLLEPKEKIKIIGVILEENIFTAQEIRFWKGLNRSRSLISQ
ncbi:MAG: hypothetical protein U9N04_03905 [Patescibacteria group bacterium]|nr:hypothetical protein [Patescibacteria group bacterium]